MIICVLPSAREDLAAGFAFYEGQSPGMGSYFMDSIFSDIDSLQLYAGVHRKVMGQHRMLCQRFPFAIYYVVENENVLINAILDCRIDPGKTRERFRP